MESKIPICPLLPKNCALLIRSLRFPSTSGSTHSRTAVPIFYDKKNTVEYWTHLSMFITFMRFAWLLPSKLPTASCFNCPKGLKMRVSNVEMTNPSHPSLYLVKCGNAATQKSTSVTPSSRSKRKGCNADSQAFLDSSAIFRDKLWPMGDICEADSCGLNSVWDQCKMERSRLAYIRRWQMNCATTV